MLVGSVFHSAAPFCAPHLILHMATHPPHALAQIEKNYYLHTSAKDAYRAYLLAYNSHALKDTFNVHRLDLAVGG